MSTATLLNFNNYLKQKKLWENKTVRGPQTAAK